MAVVCTSLALAVGVVGCLGGDDTSVPLAPPGIGFDASFDVNVPVVLDASGVVDGASPPLADAALDGAEASSHVDAGSDAAATQGTQVGLVGGGTLSQSTHYVLVGTTAPATAPVLSSPHYQLVGGMSVSNK
jgi:hypothetical protein